MGRMSDFFNKRKAAIALAYEKEDSAPKVIATGKGYVADKILETAKENNVPVHQDAKLAESLSDLNIGDSIPPELYGVVAEILVFVGDMDKIREKIS